MEGKSPKLLQALEQLTTEVGLEDYSFKGQQVSFYDSPQGEVKETRMLPEKVVFVFVPDWVVVVHHDPNNWSDVQGTWMLESEAREAIKDFKARVGLK